MPHSFLAFIDESGDDGLSRFREPRSHGGSSHWMAICACVIRKTNGLEAVSWRDSIKAGTGKNSKSRQIHFHQLKHAQKRFVSQSIAELPLIFIASLSNKKDDIPEKTFTNKNQLYFYMTRYVIERLSWFCRDNRRHVPEGDGRVKITFSRRGGMSYNNFREYLLYLKNENQTSIHWPVIDIEGIDAQDHSRIAALQLADCGARAITEAFEPDYFGNVEGSYLQILKNKIYQRKGNYLSYGLKILPTWDKATLTPQQSEIIKFFK